MPRPILQNNGSNPARPMSGHKAPRTKTCLPEHHRCRACCGAGTNIHECDECRSETPAPVSNHILGNRTRHPPNAFGSVSVHDSRPAGARGRATRPTIAPDVLRAAARRTAGTKRYGEIRCSRSSLAQLGDHFAPQSAFCDRCDAPTHRVRPSSPVTHASPWSAVVPRAASLSHFVRRGLVPRHYSASTGR
jgi:hypothetical protein